MHNIVNQVNQYQPLQGGLYLPPHGNWYSSRNMDMTFAPLSQYINQRQGNLYSPFPSQQHNILPTQNNAWVNLVQPSLTSQQQSKEQLNLVNPSNDANKKLKGKPKG